MSETERHAAPKPQTSSAAVTSLVLGMVSLILCFIGLLFVAVAIETWERTSRHPVAWILAMMFPVPSLVCGVISLKRVKNSGGRQTGGALAQIGVILSAAVLVIFPVVLPKVRQSSIRAHCVANLRLIAQAKENWARENTKKQTDTPIDADLFGMGTTYIREKPVCLKGGTYTLHPVNLKPACSVPGHTF